MLAIFLHFTCRFYLIFGNDAHFRVIQNALRLNLLFCSKFPLPEFKNLPSHIYGTVAVNEILKDYDVSAKDPFRLDDEAGKCVEIIVKKLNKTNRDLMR